MHILPISVSAAAAICDLTGYLGYRLFPEGDRTAPRRIIFGDLALTSASTDATQWGECVAVIANLVAATGCGVPVIAYDGGLLAEGHDGHLAALQYRADLVVNYFSKLDGALIISRTEGSVDLTHWSTEVLARLDEGGPQFVPPSRHPF